MNKIEEGIAANDTAITDVKNNYMPVSGGFFMGAIGIGGNVEIIGAETLKLSNDGSITFPERASRLTGISDDKGTSSTLAASLKCLANNYLPLSGGTIDGELFVGHDIDTTGEYCSIKSGSIVSSTLDGNAKIEALNNNDGSNIRIFPAKIVFNGEGDTLKSTFTGLSDSTGTSSTLAVSQKCLSDNYMPKTGGAAFSNPIAINGNLDMYGTISFPDAPYSNKLTAIVDDKGTSSTTAVSQKCLNDNYVAKSDLPSNLLKYQVINSTSDIGTDANTAYLILE